MKPIATIGVILIILGILGLAYQGFTYTKEEKVAEIGSLNITNETEKRVNIPPYAGGLSLVAGIVLVALGRRRP